MTLVHEEKFWSHEQGKFLPLDPGLYQKLPCGHHLEGWGNLIEHLTECEGFSHKKVIEIIDRRKNILDRRGIERQSKERRKDQK